MDHFRKLQKKAPVSLCNPCPFSQRCRDVVVVVAIAGVFYFCFSWRTNSDTMHTVRLLVRGGVAAKGRSNPNGLNFCSRNWELWFPVARRVKQILNCLATDSCKRRTTGTSAAAPVSPAMNIQWVFWWGANKKKLTISKLQPDLGGLASEG